MSRVIGEMPLLWLRVDGPAGSASLRGYIERNSIALLRNYDREPLDPASGNWLGLHCPKDKVRRSGLWNRRHVKEVPDRSFLSTFEQLVDEHVGAGGGS